MSSKFIREHTGYRIRFLLGGSWQKVEQMYPTRQAARLFALRTFVGENRFAWEVYGVWCN